MLIGVPSLSMRDVERRLRISLEPHEIERIADYFFACELAGELENILSGGRNNIRVGSAGPCAANLYGPDSHDRGLVVAEIS
jgi:hypothetical protein